VVSDNGSQFLVNQSFYILFGVSRQIKKKNMSLYAL